MVSDRPRYVRSAATASEGVSAVSRVVASHGSIFRETPQQTDIGVDGFLEPVFKERPFGILAGLQIKSGESYVAADGESFKVAIDEKHIKYWQSLPMPILVVCYRPSEERLAFALVHDSLDHAECHSRRTTILRVPFDQPFDAETIDRLMPVFRRYADQFKIVEFLDGCLSEDPEVRLLGARVVAQHPATINSRIAIKTMRLLLADADSRVREVALFYLGYCVGRIRWSWNPNNKDELEIRHYSAQVCKDLSSDELAVLIQDVREGPLAGPDSQTERLADICHCAWSSVGSYLENVCGDESQPRVDRQSACWISRGASFDDVVQAIEDGDDEARDLLGDILAS